jgi:hypothetical protein
MPRLADHLVVVQDVLGSEVVGGEVRVKVGDKAENKGTGANCSVWGPDGFYACPNDPDDDGAAMAAWLVDGLKKRVIGMRDNRNAPKVGNMQPGDRMIVSRGEARFLLKADTDAISIYTKNQNAPEAESSIVITADGAAGTCQLINGKSFVSLERDKLLIGCGSAVLEMSADGSVRLLGSTVWVGGGSTLLGVLPGGQAPVPGINSALIGPSALAGIPSSTVTVAI